MELSDPSRPPAGDGEKPGPAPSAPPPGYPEPATSWSRPRPPAPAPKSRGVRRGPRPKGIAIALAVAGIALAVFGLTQLTSGDPEAAPSERALIEAVLTRSFTQSNPAHCEELYTQALMDQLSFGTGPIAQRNCVEQEEQTGGEADAVSISRMSIDGEQAVATVAIDGGAMDQASIRVELARDEAGWKLHQLARIDLDRDAYMDSLATRYLEDGLTQVEATCVAERVARQYPVREIEQSFMDQEQAAEPDVSLGCLTTDTLREKMIEGVREGWAERGLPADLRDCMLTSLRGLPADTLRQLFDESRAEAGRAVTENLMRACVSAQESRSSL